LIGRAWKGVAVAALVAAAAGATAGSAGSAVRAADSRPPTQTIFASSSQQVNRLYLLITVHESGSLRVSATAGGKRFRTVRKRVTQHIPNRVYLKMSTSALRSVRRAIKRHSVYASVKSTGSDRSGNSRTYTKRIKLRR
jgi:hypothetical protein